MKFLSEILKKSIISFDLSQRFAFFSLSTKFALDRAVKRKTEINTVIDIGASDGRWSIETQKFFPKAFYFLIEAQQEHEFALKKLKNKIQNFNYSICAAGDKNGTIYFDSTDLFGGLATSDNAKEGLISVPVSMIDSLVKENNLKGPFLLKLDTHGFEVPIFEGANETLKKTNLIIVETYNFRITKDSLLFGEMCAYLATKGFRCVDISEPMFRKKDKSFWQIDLFFIPSSSPIFSSEDYE